ncbi:MAG: ferrous iron transport protein A [Planctomycetaceae bacterium]|nr:ferrous iron transport protein A [Planctomycetaceae bacterium]MBN8599505.1 ferrous iron transport protein A [Planctomycetota bacterium]
MNLADLKVGQQGTIIQVVGDDTLALRLMEMGLIEGEVVRLLGKAPMGEPLEFAYRSSRLSLRKLEATRVEIELLKDST